MGFELAEGLAVGLLEILSIPLEISIPEGDVESFFNLWALRVPSFNDDLTPTFLGVSPSFP